VWDAADWPTRDATDLASLTGQRPADVLKMRLPDVRDGFLWLTQRKTRTKLRMAIAGELAALTEGHSRPSVQGDKFGADPQHSGTALRKPANGERIASTLPTTVRPHSRSEASNSAI
jgi:integrase